MVVSARRSPRSPARNFSSGISWTLNGRLETETIRRSRLASHANPLQLMPPTLPGTARIPFRLGGVKIVDPVTSLSALAQDARSWSVRPKTLSRVMDCGISAGRLENGWVGAAASPGMSLAGTGRSSIGRTGFPVAGSSA